MVGAGRDNDVDQAAAPSCTPSSARACAHLDRNVTLLGRVVSGMDLLSAPRRAARVRWGATSTPEQFVPVKSMRVAADVPAAQRTDFEILRTDTPTFLAYVEARRSRHEEWFKVPAGHVDVCNVPVPSRRVAPKP